MVTRTNTKRPITATEYSEESSAHLKKPKLGEEQSTTATTRAICETIPEMLASAQDA
ncbi:MAG: hypothetical protein CM15mP49_13840 [Actinomycetota bacterium]|nr:MAG: hypothetical protein CM15mP49_13840 [Actinomycetota bacterium]